MDPIPVAFRLFARVWTLPIIADLAVRNPAGGGKSLLLLAALVVFVWPGTVLLFSMLAAVFLYAWVPRHDGEHGYVAAVMSATTLIAVLSHVVTRRRWPAPTDLYAALRTPARVVAFTLFFAGFAKLNRDFIDHRISCGGVYYLWLREWPGLSFLPTSPLAKSVAIYGSLLLEMGGPLLLLFARTRKLGLVFTWAVLFGICSLPRAVYFTFAGLFWVCSLFFVEPEALLGPARLKERVWRWARAGLERWWGGRRVLVSAALFVVGLLPAAMLVVLVKETEGEMDVLSWPHYAWRVVGLVVMVGVASSVGAAWWRARRGASVGGSPPTPALEAPPTGWRRSVPAVLALVFPGLMILNEVSVYVGLDHRPALRMASNAVLVPVGGNHLVFQPVPTFSFTADVEVTSVTGGSMPVGHHMARPLFEELVSRLPPGARVGYRVSGGEPKALVVEEGGRSGSLLARVLPLRPYRPATEPAYCPKSEPGLSFRETMRRMKRRVGR